jgi:hypothetical protein
MSSKLQILTDFKKNLVSFLDELIQQFPEEGDLIVLRIFLNDQVPIEEVMKSFSEKCIPLKDVIKKRDESFFLNENVLFSKIDQNKVNHFRRLWTSPKLDNEDRNVIWAWYDAFILLAEKYIKSA